MVMLVFFFGLGVLQGELANTGSREDYSFLISMEYKV